jgi:hypothetical protein
MSKPPFLTLPSELRNEIYDYALAWPDLSKPFAKIRSEESSDNRGISNTPPLCLIPIPFVEDMTTPPTLLVNRQVTSEALAVLRKKPLVLTQTPPYLPQLAKPMDITEFISETTLQGLTRVVLDMDLSYSAGRPDQARAWLKTVETLLDVWCVRNSLERLEIRGHYVPPRRDIGWWTFGEASHHRHVMSLLCRVGDSLLLN